MGKKHISEIKEITSILEKGKIDDNLINLFKVHLQNLEQIEWKSENLWISEIYNFGEQFNNKNPEKFFEILNSNIKNGNEELYCFIKSEIYINFFDLESSIEYLLGLVKKYELNSDFSHSLSVLYQKLEKWELASKYLRNAIKISNKRNWIDELYLIEYNLATKLIEKKNHSEAKLFLENIVNSNFYKNKGKNDLQNYFIFLKQRNEDQLLIEEKLITISEKSENTIKELFEKSRLKTIEMLSFLIAIVAFIFGSVNFISKSNNLKQSLLLIFSFGLSLLIFSLTISLIFNNKKIVFWKEIRLYLIIFLLLIISSLIIFSEHLE